MWRLIVALFVLALLGGGAVYVATTPAIVPADVLPAHRPNLDNGRTMLLAGGCPSCHATPDQEDDMKLGGGMELKSPYGSFYPPNISPDPNDGIGGWNESQFVTALWKGTSPDGRHYYPAFPYTSYQHMSLGDVRDLFAFLKTLSPVAGKVRPHELRFPYNIRRVLGLWKLLYLDGKAFASDQGESAQWNRGAYLVNGPAHCVECHSPRDLFGGIVARQRFAGGPSLDGEGFVPNITQAGIGSYSVADIKEILTTGAKPDGDMVGGDMKSVVRETAELSKEDRAAIATYVKSLGPVEGPKPPKKGEARGL
jgi:mono/diheme cytochrome c family protein